MKRMMICTLTCYLSMTAVAAAQESTFKSMWPFGSKETAETPNFDNINPFTTPTKVAKKEKGFGLPSATNVFDKAGSATGTVFSKTKDSWKGVQGFGKSLNPFNGKAKATKPKKKKAKQNGSFFDRLLPKKKPAPPATVGEFLNMKRPSI